MARLWAKTVTFDSLAPGDQLPILVKWETEATIRRFSEDLFGPGATAESGDSESGASKVPSGTGNIAPWGPMLAAYVAELLEKGFPIPGIMAQGSRLALKLLQPVSPEDTLAISGTVVDKREEDGRRLVDCRILVESKEGATVAVAEATVCL